jgi:hypothetical protein
MIVERNGQVYMFSSTKLEGSGTLSAVSSTLRYL